MPVSRKTSVDVLTVACIFFATYALIPASAIPSVTPLNWFEIGSSGRLVDVSGAGNRLYFLLKDGPRYELVLTDEAGANSRRFPVALFPGMTPPKLIRGNGTGDFVIGFGQSRGGIAIRIFDSKASLVDERTLDAAIDVQFLGKRVIAIGYRELRPVYDLASGDALHSTPVPLDIQEPLAAAPIGQDDVAIVGMISGQLMHVSLSSASIFSSMLRSPEIDSFPKTAVMADEGIIVATSGSASGELYCEVPGSKIHEGIVIAQFGRSGDLRARFRCILPRFGVTEEPPYGYLRPHRLVATEHSLYIVDPVARRVARCGKAIRAGHRM